MPGQAAPGYPGPQPPDNDSGGTVTSVSVVTANGFSGSVATATTTPAITLSYTGAGVPYDLACAVVGVPDASAVVLRFVAVRAFTLSASGQRGTAGVAATAQADFIVSVNATTKATLRFAAAGTTITVVGGTAATIAAGDIILITAPASPDATLADIGFSLTGTLL